MRVSSQNLRRYPDLNKKTLFTRFHNEEYATSALLAISSSPGGIFFSRWWYIPRVDKLADQNQDHIGSISISRKDGLNVCQSEMGRGRQAERHSEVERKGRVEAKVRQRTIIDIAQYLTRE